MAIRAHRKDGKAPGVASTTKAYSAVIEGNTSRIETLQTTRTAADDEVLADEERWQALYDSANEYCSSSRCVRAECVRRLEAILAESPPRDIALKCQLRIAAMYSSLFDPDKGESEDYPKAMKILEQVVKDHPDLANWFSIMHAKINLGDLYCLEYELSIGKAKAEPLYWQVIDVPEEEILLEDARLNLKEISSTVPVRPKWLEPWENIPEDYIERHRNRLMKRRKTKIEFLRSATVRALAYKQFVVGNPQLTLAALHRLKKMRPDDATFQKTLDHVVSDFRRSHPGLEAHAPSIEEIQRVEETF
jgi:tetratricopeptide (TPR) repeat protein